MTQHIYNLEVKHDERFERYLVYTKKLKHMTDKFTHLNSVNVEELSPSKRRAYQQLRESIIDNNLTGNLDEVYFMTAPPMYVSGDNEVVVTINDTNETLFNTPINLMYNAVCTKHCEVTISPPTNYRNKIEFIRCTSQVVITSSCEYVLNSAEDYLCINQLHPRSVQYKDAVHLLRSDRFSRMMNNGNLTLAFADIYFNNVDDDVIELTNITPKIVSISYDQYTGTVEGNDVEIILTSQPDRPEYFKSTELDSRLVDILTEIIKEILISNN